MKISKAERKKMAEPSSLAEGDQPLYPWGLGVNLDKDALEKLGIDELPKAGVEYLLVARVEVTSVGMNESTSGESKNMGLQITEMCLEAAPKKGAKASKALYGGDD